MESIAAKAVLSQKVMTFRSKKKLTSLDMERLTGVSRRTLGRIESEFGYNPTMDTLIKLSSSMHIPVSSLIGQKLKFKVTA